jgi:hypothetical protein
MSVNLEVSVQREDDGSTVVLLTGFSRGITHSASVEMGETVIFRLSTRQVRVRINDVQHEWQSGGSKISPVSTALGECSAILTANEFQELLDMGFEEI